MTSLTNRRRWRTATIVCGVLATLAVVTGCGRSPSETVKEFSAAGKAQDTDKLKALMSKESVAKIGPMLDMAKDIKAKNKDTSNPMDEVGDVTVKSEEIKGDTAVVTALATKKDGTSHESKIDLVKEDGEWKVDLLATGKMAKPNIGK